MTCPGNGDYSDTGCVSSNCLEPLLLKGTAVTSVVDVHVATDSTNYQVAGVTSVFNWRDFFLFSNAPCPIQWCQIWNTGALSTDIAMDTYAKYQNFLYDASGNRIGSIYNFIQYNGASAGNWYYKRSRPFSMTMRVRCATKYFWKDHYVSFSIPCHATSTTISTTTAPLQTYDMVQGTFHSFIFPKFTTTEVNCPITYTLTRLAGNTEMDTVITNTAALGAMTVYIQNVPGYDLLEKDFQFTITATAVGGSTFTTPTWTLRTNCGVANSALGSLAPSTGTSRTIVLNVDNFYFEITGVTNTLTQFPCPVTSVEYLDSFGLPHPNLASSGGDSPIVSTPTTYRATPVDLITEQNIPFTLKVTVKNGIVYTYSYTLISICTSASQTLSFTPTASYGSTDIIHTELLDSWGGTFSVSFPKFVESFPTGDCRIISYQVLDNNMNPHPDLSISTYNNIDKTYTVDFPTSTLVTNVFFIKAFAHGGATQISSRIILGIVCGSETVSIIPAPTPLVVFSKNVTQDYSIQANWYVLFVSDKAQCPIQNFKIYKDATLTTLVGGPSDEIQVFVDVSTQISYLRSNPHVQTQHTFYYLWGYTSSQTVGNFMPIEVIVCGFETLETIDDYPVTFFNDISSFDTYKTLSNAVLESYFQFTAGPDSDMLCAPGPFAIFEDLSCKIPWTNTSMAEIVIDPGTSLQVLHVKDDTAFRETPVFLRRITQGLVWAAKEIRIETCGSEQVINSTAMLNATFFKQPGLQYLRGWAYMSSFDTDSRFCKITSVSVWFLQSNGVYIPYSDGDVSVHSTNGDVSVDTSLLKSKMLQIQFLTRGQQVGYVPLNVTVSAIQLSSNLADLVNHAPEIEGELANFTQIVSLNTQVVRLQVPMQKYTDDIQLTSIDVFSPFGKLKYTFAPGSSTPQLVTSSSNKISYDHEAQKIIVTTDDLSNILGNQKFTFIVTDSGNKTLNYEITLTVLDKAQFERKQPINDTANNKTIEINQNACTARIESVNSLGDVLIRFNTEMKNEGLNLTLLNDTIMDLYLEPRDDWATFKSGFNMSFLNFTWNVTEYKLDFMIIKLQFVNPYEISPLAFQDKLVVHIKDKQSFFISKTLLVDLHSNYTTLRHKVPKQMIDNQVSSVILDSAQATKSMMQGSVISTIIVNVFLAMSMQFVISMINSLQLIFHLPIMSVIAPGNVIQMFQIMIPIVMFDVLEALDVFDGIFPDSKFDMANDENLLDQLRDLSYDSYNPIMNLGTLLFMVVIWFTRVLFHYLILRPMFNNLYIRGPIFFKMKNQLFFSHILMILLEGYMEYVISFRLVLEMPEKSVDNTELTFYINILSMIISMFLMPGIFIWLLFKSEFELRKRKTFRRKWQSLYEDLRPNSKAALFFNLLFVLRRLIYVETAFSLNLLPCQQIQILMFMNLFAQVYLGNVQPMVSRELNIIELLNDLFVYIVTLHFLLFMDFVPEQETKYQIGYSCIFFVSLSIIYNLWKVFRIPIRALKMLAQKFFNRIYNFINKKIKYYKQQKKQEKTQKMLSKISQVLKARVEERLKIIQNEIANEEAKKLIGSGQSINKHIEFKPKKKFSEYAQEIADFQNGKKRVTPEIITENLQMSPNQSPERIQAQQTKSHQQLQEEYMLKYVLPHFVKSNPSQNNQPLPLLQPKPKKQVNMTFVNKKSAHYQNNPEMYVQQKNGQMRKKFQFTPRFAE